MISEILLLHHTHTDVGYTHPQPVFWELQQRIIDEAIDLCEQTADAPEVSRVRWTCEVTWPVMHWLHHAPARQIDRFRALAAAGQLSVGALPLHLSPCANLPQFAHGLRAVGLLREALGVPIRVAVSHDVNGQPWPLAELLLDSGVEALFMGINIHSGGFPYQRPRWLRWHGPDGRPLPVFNGTHYNTFTRESRYPSGCTATMQQALDSYLGHLTAAGHPPGFTVLTATNPFNSDNYPPDPLLAQMVRRWNDEGRLPLIRFATPEMVLDRFLQQATVVPDLSGDWSDYWNFGAASSATETRVNRQTARRLLAAGMLRTAVPNPNQSTRNSLAAWRNLVLFDEHTWGADRTVQSAQTDLADEQWILNAAHAWQARSLTGHLLRDAFDHLAANPGLAIGPRSLLCFNPAPVPRDCFLRIPTAWRDGTWRHCASNSARIEQDQLLWNESNSSLIGPVSLAPHSLAVLPMDGLTTTPCDGIDSGTDFIETPFHRLGFDPLTGSVTSLLDKTLQREFIDPAAEWPFFGFVHETVDPAHHDLTSGDLGRDAYYETNWDKLHADLDCWNYEWKALRRGAGRLLEIRLDHEPDGISLVTIREAPGVCLAGGGTESKDGGWLAHLPRALVQRIKLSALRPVVELSATFHKEDTRHAESIYFAFPLDLEHWDAHYDAAGVPTRWDDEQLDGTCKNWVSTSSWVSVHNATAGVTLATPDTPLVQIGDFGFGRRQGIGRHRAKPLLLGWAVNNYWMTNFRASQPGPMRFRYELHTHGPFDPVRSTHAGLVAACPVEVHPAMAAPPAARRFIRVSDPAVVPVLFAPCDDGGGSLLVLLQNAAAAGVEVTVDLPGCDGRIFQSNALGERVRLLANQIPFTLSMPPRGHRILRVDPVGSVPSPPDDQSHPCGHPPSES